MRVDEGETVVVDRVEAGSSGVILEVTVLAGWSHNGIEGVPNEWPPKQSKTSTVTHTILDFIKEIGFYNRI